jgi:hypothetical protein
MYYVLCGRKEVTQYQDYWKEAPLAHFYLLISVRIGGSKWRNQFDCGRILSTMARHFCRRSP